MIEMDVEELNGIRTRIVVEGYEEVASGVVDLQGKVYRR